MNKDKVYLKGYVIGRAADTLGYHGLMVQLENLDIVEIDKNLVHKEIGEPQKVTVPQFVADWIKYCKNTGVTLVRALLVEEIDLYNYANQKDSKELKEFLRVEENQEKFTRAWLDGYTVEEEKRYYVRLKGVDENYNYLNCIKHLNEWVLTEIKTDKKFRSTHTRKELEEAGFGEVFNSSLFEVEEVEG